MAQPVPDDADTLVELSYAQFGRSFFEAAVTTERVAEPVGDLAGQPVDG